MAFTTSTVTHKFETADGNPAAGSVTFRLTKRMTNGGVTLVPSEVTVNFDGTGSISQALTSNNDVGTVPGDAMWEVTVRVANQAIVGPYPIAVPSGGQSVDLMSLLPQNMIGNA